jgi:dihydroneopterin aldolase
VEFSSFGSVESLASLIARIVVVEFGHEKVTVLVQKPSALAFVEGSGLEITRSRDFFQ